jgi:hypothetical protein
MYAGEGGKGMQVCATISMHIPAIRVEERVNG